MKALQRVLYVEDEPDIQAVARVALEMVGGFSVEICSSGEDALRIAEGFSPDIVLLDVMMPGMDGPTTLARLRELPALSMTPVIFMTARIQQHEVKEYESIGAVGVIPKPFDPMTLSDQVRALWAERGGG
ncbi:response regulator [Acidihalobacter prosperus]|uniref:Chemotaxis protein CheY n=1 Tax=Acidihalobacter prosperus TaxID=160660 RepID=A0A1A6C7P1_9GAMM|nr:response regulator [Acidihalobacter prosperus]OBS10564.1 chemotaxis protein CheY [Acidihalobacter prosperus]